MILDDTIRSIATTRPAIRNVHFTRECSKGHTYLSFARILLRWRQLMIRAVMSNRHILGNKKRILVI
nr:hypothetical protein [Tanacetum cinerariifolium]